ncbi:hypothetical protein H4R20_004696 [Coemansia guatemalensis]|uniref:Uncharacterized protein n=1 Tax=Coemansia guatemalensis TaxID=2761395 RepID=A0A9W8HZE8_9FUNG|nr:hypothetical protein H4R20_004696 [Coemansia guatemalensis]
MIAPPMIVVAAVKLPMVTLPVVMQPMMTLLVVTKLMEIQLILTLLPMAQTIPVALKEIQAMTAYLKIIPMENRIQHPILLAVPHRTTLKSLPEEYLAQQQSSSVCWYHLRLS